MYNFHSQNVLKNSKISYFQHVYDDSHWACHLPTENDENAIANIKVAEKLFSIIFHPDDARGYRTIVRLIDEDNVQSTFNRAYTIEEKIAHSYAINLIAMIYEQGYQLVAQIQTNGNNAQSMSDEGKIQLGNLGNPSMLHSHIIGRGDPSHAYIVDIPLRGPKLGVAFDGRGLSEQQKKVPWSSEELMKVRYDFSQKLLMVYQESAEFYKNIDIVWLKNHKESEAIIPKNI